MAIAAENVRKIWGPDRVVTRRVYSCLRQQTRVAQLMVLLGQRLASEKNEFYLFSGGGFDV